MRKGKKKETERDNRERKREIIGLGSSIGTANEESPQPLRAVHPEVLWYQGLKAPSSVRYSLCLLDLQNGNALDRASPSHYSVWLFTGLPPSPSLQPSMCSHENVLVSV